MIFIKNDERGLLFKNGNYAKYIKPGKFHKPLFGKYNCIIFNVNNKFNVHDKNINLFLEDKNLIEDLDVIDLKDNEIALHYEDSKFTEVLSSGKHAFWKILKKHEFLKIDLNEPEVDEKIDRYIFNTTKLSGFAVKAEIASYENGLLFFDSVFQKILQPGIYYFWSGEKHTSVQKVDMRQQQIDMTGQEIMTLDKVSLRLNFICHYKVTDPYKNSIEIKSSPEQIYILLQLILREYVGTLKLDELLIKKEEIGEYVLKNLKEKSNQFGVEFLFAGVKDIILPGEVKDILNMVLIAEKKAMANIITRREETASTRSLLNTAKLMDENKTLFKLKEMEYIEKICEKINNITLTGGSSISEQLINVLVGKKIVE